MNTLSELLASKVVIFDGAMGTEIYKKNFFVNTSYENLCVTNPETISAIHQSYADAGADVLTTNTYSANCHKLSRFGLAENFLAINQAAVQLARAIADDKGLLVAASVGPVNDLEVSALRDGSAKKILAEHVDVLLHAGADFILFETLPSLSDFALALEVMQDYPNVQFVTSITLTEEAESQQGESYRLFLSEVARAKHKPSALGINCGIGPEAMLSAVEKIIEQVTLPLIVQPNAGMPKPVDGRLIYMCNPEYLCNYARRYINLGARGVGGCCGTGPEHIAMISKNINPLAKAERNAQRAFVVSTVPLKDALPMQEKSQLAAKLQRGEWVTSVEIVPPLGFDLNSTIEKARLCKSAGIDAMNIPDGPRASARISPMVSAYKIQQEAGIEAVLHFCCRDKNLIGMQADLLGCANLGINNILFITGDPPKLGDYPFASAVFDIDSVGLTKIVANLNRGVDIGGKEIKPQTRTLIGVGADPNAVDMAREIRRTKEKIDGGAEFLITQPIFSVDSFMRFMDAVPELARIKVIAGVWPLAHYRNAEFMRNEVPGVVVPDSIMERMAAASTQEAQKAVGIAIARETIVALRSRINGVQVSAPFGNVQTAISVLAK